MKVVKVYGALKERLGQGRFEFDVNTPAEALRALMANFPGLDKWLIDSEKDGVGYKVKVGQEEIGEDNIEDLALPWSVRDVFSIAPVMTGAGRGTGRILLGVVLVGAAVLTGGASLAAGAGGLSFGAVAGAGTWGTIAAVGANFGVSMALSGIAEMLSPAPPGAPPEANVLQNYSFSGVVNTAQVGTPVPITYGRLYVGSSVISTGLDVDQVL